MSKMLDSVFFLLCGLLTGYFDAASAQGAGGGGGGGEYALPSAAENKTKAKSVL